MPKTEGDPLGPELTRRLRRELDRVQPRFSSPRYLAAGGRPALRIAPAALAVSLVGIVALTFFAATGSPNPAVWTEHVMTVIHPIAASPTPSATPQNQRGATGGVTAGQQGTRQSSPQTTQRPEPSERAEPSEKPQPRQSPEPSDDHSGSGSGGNSGDGSGGGGGDSGSGSGGSHRGSE